MYIGYFLVAFSVANMHQLLVAFTFISVFLFLVQWQYFNITYLFFGYHSYHVTTDAGTKVFVICRKEIRTPEHLRFSNLRRVSNTTFIERGDTTYYPGGMTDPDYCVLKFTAHRGRYYSNFDSESFDVGKI